MSLNKFKGSSSVRLIGALVLTASLILTAAGIAGANPGPVGNAQGFEDDDGNLVVNSTFDWNGFAPVNWLPSPSATPTRQANTTVGDFHFLGLEDWEATTSDSGFAGGTKQDQDCPSVITAKADNKADLKRVYVAAKDIGGEFYLDLAWVRIPQNTTSPSAHVAFEFNQGTTPCGPGSDGLVHRSTANGGDLLIVYDFEGGSTDVPHITLRRWIGSGTCDISNDSPPCWGPATDLTNLGFAEAKVNTFGAVQDNLAPPALSSSTGASTSATLGTSEFGEAGLDLGAAGANIFPANQCVNFAKVFGVSRTSGNSGTAQMKDLVGPGDFRLSNCGEIRIIKQTDGRGLNQNFSYTTTGGLSPSSFTLNDNGNAGKTLGSTLLADNSSGNTQTYSDVLAGSYSVTEGADPTGFVFESLTCTSSGSGTSVSPASSTVLKTATITLAGDGRVTCLYINKQQLGAIKITKTSTKSGNPTLPGAQFSIKSGGTAISGSPFTTDSNGVICVDHLPFGTYSVQETAAPTGYSIDDSTAHNVSINANSTCGDGQEATFSATNTPLTDLLVKATGEASPAGTTKSTITCVDSNNAAIGNSPQGPSDPAEVDANGLKPGTYTCTVVVDP